FDAQRRFAGRPSGHRQDHAGQSGGRRGGGALLLDVGLGVRRDVRGHGRFQSARPVQAGQRESALHRVYRRDRRHRPEAQHRQRHWRQRRARADLNQLLTEMDGFESNNGVIILAATNRPESLDPALTRPGRFDRRVPVELPDLAGREAILKVHARKIKTDGDVDFHTIARMAAGTSGAELANIINEAALRAVRAGRTVVTQADLEESIEVVIAGYQKKNAILSDQEKRVVAYHEIGHALVAALQTASAPVQKITIIPRTSGALGYTMQVDTADKNLLTKEELENKIATLTGGRAAEEVAFGQITTGASNDIEQATKLARAMIT